MCFEGSPGGGKVCVPEGMHPLRPTPFFIYIVCLKENISHFHV